VIESYEKRSNNAAILFVAGLVSFAAFTSMDETGVDISSENPLAEASLVTSMLAWFAAIWWLAKVCGVSHHGTK